jgi:Nif-specific regulatory protein
MVKPSDNAPAPPTISQTADATGTTSTGDLYEALHNLERERILDALRFSRGNQTKAARLLGITERVMGLRVKKYGIEPKRFSTKK